MLPEEYQNKVNQIYSEYINDLKPLIAYVEHNYSKFPKGVLKEFRDVFDHIARLYTEDEDEKYYIDTLDKAANHFSRLKLDIYKYLCDYEKKKISSWHNKYSKYDLSVIDNGDFWQDIVDGFDNCEVIFFNGRNIEHKDVVAACNFYQQYLNEADKIFECIEGKRDLIKKAVFKQRKASFISGFFGFILGIISSIIASFLYAVMCNLYI